MASSQPIDLITKSLSAIGAHAPGEAVESGIADQCFDLLNDMLDQWSNDKQLLYCVQEVIHELVGSQYVYTIGNGGMVGAVFQGSISGDTLTVTALTSGAISVGQTIGGTGIAAGTAITSLGTALGGNGVGALGTYKVQISQTAPATTTQSVGSVSINNPGFGYASPPALAFGGPGVGAAATATLGLVAAYTGTFGAGYTPGDILTLVGGTFTRPAVIRKLTAGNQLTPPFEILDQGDYSVIPGTLQAVGPNLYGQVAVTGGTGAGGFVNCAWGIGAVTVTNPGTGYTVPPTVTPSGGTPDVQGILTAVLTGGTGNITITSYARRPLRINSAFVRINNSASGTLDYPVSVVHMEQYERLGIKTLPGPWPTAVYYQPSEPLGVLNYWPNPSQGEMHLFCDTILNRFQTLTDTIIFPQGYFMALMWNLAEILIPFFPATAAAAETRALIPQYAAIGRGLIKRTNMVPQQTMGVDPAIAARRGADAGWILSGGFYR